MEKSQLLQSMGFSIEYLDILSKYEKVDTSNAIELIKENEIKYEVKDIDEMVITINTSLASNQYIK